MRKNDKPEFTITSLQTVTPLPKPGAISVPTDK